LLFDAFVEFGPAGSDVLPSGDLMVDLKRELRAAVAELTERRFDQVCRVLVHEARTDLVTLLLMPRRMAVEERLRSAQRLGEVWVDVEVPAAAELLLGPVYQRWLLRTAPLTGDFTDAVVDLVLRALRG
jgi:hypothetical protein